jgi:hypothetical protein
LGGAGSTTGAGGGVSGGAGDGTTGVGTDSTTGKGGVGPTFGPEGATVAVFTNLAGLAVLTSRMAFLAFWILRRGLRVFTARTTFLTFFTGFLVFRTGLAALRFTGFFFAMLCPLRKTWAHDISTRWGLPSFGASTQRHLPPSHVLHLRNAGQFGHARKCTQKSPPRLGEYDTGLSGLPETISAT